MNQFKLEILLLQRPIEKEDVRAIVVNNQNPGCGNNRSIFQTRSPLDKRRQAALHHSTVDGGAVCDDTCVPLTTKSWGAVPI
jgi:hypothetical protein